MKRKAFITVIVVCVVACGVILALVMRSSRESKEELRISKVVKRDLGAMVQATGVIKPLVGAEVKVGARLPGKVVELPIKVGDKVEEGDVIARIEQDDLKAKVSLQDAILEEAKAEEMRIARDFERDKQLEGTQSISSQKYDLTLALFAIAKARVKKAQAELDFAGAQLSYAVITAPIKGVVASVNTIQGETVTTGLNAPTFIRIIDLDRLEALAYVDENDIGKVRVGQEAIFTVAAHPSVEFKGVVTSIYPSATIQDNVVYYITSVSVDNREGKLRPDMTTNVLIFMDKRKGVLAVPNKAIQREGARKFVYVVEKGVAEKAYVVTGWKDSVYTEILEGLREGLQVALEDPSGKKPMER